ncbi:2-C-methyl-D-erythritol 2,4-cyclodiphosphate synthase [bacterium]|nr:MAG: 2-C-methyl-D-erythritol 2,4-cyclodiphosphate synthase [bacterium]
MFRIGLGQDSHKLISNFHPPAGGPLSKSLVLGGVKITEKYYLEADSDGDVILHALCNALSTSIGGGSLDTWTGEMFRNGITDSKEYLRKILIKVKAGKYKINNVAIMVEAATPKLEKHREEIQKSLAKLLEIEAGRVGMAFTSGEELTSFGRGEGIQVISTVLIEK